MGPTNQIQIIDMIKLHGEKTNETKSIKTISEQSLLKDTESHHMFTSDVTLDPKSHPAPLGLTAQVSISSGSLHIRSQKGPS